MDFVERLVAAQDSKRSIAVLGIDPQLDTPKTPGVPAGYDLARFCCEIVEACAPFVVAIRDPLFFGRLPQAGDVAYVIVAALVALVVAAAVFRRVDDQLAAHL